MGIAAKTGGELSHVRLPSIFRILLGTCDAGTPAAAVDAVSGKADRSVRRPKPARRHRAWAAATGRGQPVRAGRPVRSKADRTGQTIPARGVAVNAFLWRASLDTINFIPLVSADPFGGVIITDWYTPAETPNERMKVQVTILDRELRADGVRVSVFKQQTRPKGGNWVDAQVDPRTNTDIENAILTRARQLRIAAGLEGPHRPERLTKGAAAGIRCGLSLFGTRFFGIRPCLRHSPHKQRLWLQFPRNRGQVAESLGGAPDLSRPNG